MELQKEDNSVKQKERRDQQATSNKTFDDSIPLSVLNKTDNKNDDIIEEALLNKDGFFCN